MSFSMNASSVRRHGVTFGTIVTLIALARPVVAQAPLDSADRAAIARDSAAGMTWMFASPKDWSRYLHPGQCVAAMNVVQMWTMFRTNTYHPMAQDDTLSTAARTVGKACAARLSVSSVSPHDWRQFHQLALMLDDLPLAHAIVESQLTRASTPDEKSSVVMDALRNFEGRDPRQVAAADSLVAHMTSFGPEARWWRVIALQSMPIAPAFDTTQWVSRKTQTETEFKAISHEDRLKSGFPGQYLSNLWIAIQEFSHAAPADICPAYKRGILGLGNDTIAGNAPSMFWGALESDCEREVATIGQPVQPLSGGQWFKVGDTTGVSSIGYPVPGHVTLVVNEPLSSGRISKNVAMYTRLYRKYHEKGFDLVLIHRRQGFVWGSGLLAPSKETEIIRWYDHDYLKLPFPIAVYDSAATDMPGRLLVGKDGRQLVGTMAIDVLEPNESVLDAFIGQALDDSAKRQAPAMGVRTQ